MKKVRNFGMGCMIKYGEVLEEVWGYEEVWGGVGQVAYQVSVGEVKEGVGKCERV